MNSSAEATRTSGRPAPGGTVAVQLPVQLSSFIGREREIATVRRQLVSTRLLTLTGAGGSGKTRLALEVAAQVAGEYTDGLGWVELAALSDPHLLAQEIAATLSIREEPGRSPIEALLDFLSERSQVLVLDNCEHLADACALLAEILLRGSPGLKILATSREALGVAGERAWLVPPLSLPDPKVDIASAELAGFEAVQLFIERAQDVVPSFRLTEDNADAVAQICRRLDGIPLAIELAAARVKVLSPVQIGQRLDNAFALLTSGSRTSLPRHRTLRATIDWSYELLSEPEQLLLRHLSVFAGGFSLEAAEAVCADDRLETWEVLDVLARLVDRSLVVMREHDGVARYHLLDTVRQYACQRSHESGEAQELQRRHAEHFLALAREAEPYVILDRRQWMTRLDLELDNFRSALAWSHAAGIDDRIGLPLATALIWYWYHRQMRVEALRLLESALAGAADSPDAARAGALHGTGIFALYVGGLELSGQRLRQAESIWRTTGNDRWLSFTLICLSTLELATGNADAAEEYAEESLRAARRTGEPWNAALASAHAVMAVRMWRKDWAGADLHLADAERVFRDCGYAYSLTFVLDARAFVALQRGDLAQAEALARLALRELATRRDEWLASRSLRVLGLTAAHHGAFDRAVRLFAASDALLSSVGARALSTERGDADEILEQARANLSESAFARMWSEGSAMDFHRALAYATGPGEGIDGEGSGRRPEEEVPSATPEAPVRPDTSASERPMAALRVLTLGPLEIYRDGELLTPELWRYARPKELLLYLLSHPEGRSKEQIGVVFWPDSSAMQVKNSFHVALHHLRKVLGHSDWIVLENDRYRLDPARTREFDAALFETGISQALRDVRAGAGSAVDLRAALDLYRGDFLQDETVGDWHLETRDHLAGLYVRGLRALGELLMRAGDWTEAATVYRKVVVKDDLHEEAHRHLMLCLAHTGDRTRALRHYENLVVLLREELDVEPEEETTALYGRLKQAAVG